MVHSPFHIQAIHIVGGFPPADNAIIADEKEPVRRITDL
jgi:hypothetical protein